MNKLELLYLHACSNHKHIACDKGTGIVYSKKELESLLKPAILDDGEKKYLSNIIAPFRDNVSSIMKVNNSNDVYYICIKMWDGFNIDLPAYPIDSKMYKRMWEEYDYSLKELGL